jgi:uncharacterized protein
MTVSGGAHAAGRDSAARWGVASGTIFPAESDEWRGEYSLLDPQNLRPVYDTGEPSHRHPDVAGVTSPLDTRATGEWNDGVTIRTSPWPAGVPCWADLMAPDVEAAREFYGRVVGWDFQDTGDDYGGYLIAAIGASAAAGIGPAPEGVPSAWTIYIASDDVDKTADAVVENSGTIMMPPGDVGDLGRMFVGADPTGAAFGVWQAGTNIGAEIVNEPGGITWEDLRSHDPDAARDFYGAVFGYTYTPMPEAGPDYAMFYQPGGEAPLGGMGGMMGAEGAPAHWIVYFRVADTDAAVTAAEGNGGTVIAPAFDTTYGRMAGITDPAGAMFWVVQDTSDAGSDESE